MASQPVSYSIALETASFIQEADQKGNALDVALSGRILLIGAAATATIEVICRIAFIAGSQFASLCTLFQSDSLHRFTKDQVKIGIAAASIATASLLSLLSPTAFPETQLVEEARFQKKAEPIECIFELQKRQAQIINSVVCLPFQMIYFTFQIPFYFLNFCFQLITLPIRIALLPLQIILYPFSFFLNPRYTQMNSNVGF